MSFAKAAYAALLLAAPVRAPDWPHCSRPLVANNCLPSRRDTQPPPACAGLSAPQPLLPATHRLRAALQAAPSLNTPAGMPALSRAHPPARHARRARQRGRSHGGVRGWEGRRRRVVQSLHGSATSVALTLCPQVYVDAARHLQGSSTDSTSASTVASTYAFQAAVPTSYWNSYTSPTNVASAPYVLNFAQNVASNGGTQYVIGSFATPTEKGDVFTVPVTGGAGPCPNGAMRSGVLTITCGAASTVFNVVEAPMCTYAMSLQTTQACPSPVPASYFNNYVAQGVQNAPYTLSFSTGTVYNGGTSYLIGKDSWPSEKGNVYTMAVTGGAGPCPNGAMRSGTLAVTCGAASTSFSVTENPMCTYAMSYSTTQACPAPIPISYFNNYQGMNVPNAPYTLNFQSGTVYNVGTSYYIGKDSWPSESGNTLITSVTGGAGPCPNGAMRSGTLTITCGAAATSFAVTENPMCTYAMSYSTTQACPTSVIASPPPSPSPPPPTVYTTTHVADGSVQFQNKVTGNGNGNPHVSNGGATSTSTDSTASGSVNKFVTTSTTDATQEATANGKVQHSSSTTDTTAQGHQVTNTVYNSPPPSPSPPPPTVYTSTGFVDPTLSTTFRNQVTGTGNGPHVLNNGASTTSTETTAQGNVNVKVTTTTTDSANQGSGNGHVTHQSTDTSTTATAHPRTHLTVNVHPSTTDVTEVAPMIPNAAAICAGAAFQIMDQAKNLCLHIKGAGAPGNFQLSAVNRPVITMQCTAGSPNQQFAWLPSATGGAVQHVASGLVLTTLQDIIDGSIVTVAPAVNSPQQQWAWANYATGGVIASIVNELFEITDSMVNAGANIGLPVHMWHLQKSLPSGTPNANWMASCPATAANGAANA